MSKEKEELLKLLKERAVKTGEFTLASGGKSNFYVDGKQVTLDPQGSYLLAKVILEKLEGLDVDAIGGLTIGADPIAAAVAITSRDRKKPISGFIVRKEVKKHGLQKEIEGIVKPGWKVVIVDDVITKGTSTAKAIKTVEKMGCKVVKVTCLVDREEGGAQTLKDYDFDPIFKKSEFT